MQKKLIAECFGTFALSLAVLSSLVGVFIIPTPIIAGLVLALFVYSIGNASGCHINPAVTVGLWSIGKIKAIEAAQYVLAQIVGALIAFGLTTSLISGVVMNVLVPESIVIFIAEIIGTMLFTFGIAAVVYGKVNDHMSGVVIGGSLLLGIIVAVQFGSAGILNPAVALALGSLNVSYALGAIIGSVLGMNLYKRFIV